MIDYGEIVSSSFKLAWKKKSLWILGLFAGGASIPTNGLDIGDIGSDNGFDASQIPFFGEHPEMIFPIIGIILLLGILYFVLHCFCVAGLIDAVNRLTRGGVYRLRDSFGEGVRYFWRTLGLFILQIFTMIFGAIVVIGIGVLAFVIHWGVGIAALLFLIPAGGFAFIMTLHTFILAYRVVVVRDTTIGNALEEGWRLFWSFKLPNVLIFFIYLGLSIVVGIGVFIIFLIAAAPFIFMAVTSSAGFWLALAIGIPLFILLSLPVSGFFNTAFEAMYTLFYFRMVEPNRGPTADTPTATA